MGKGGFAIASKLETRASMIERIERIVHQASRYRRDGV